MPHCTISDTYPQYPRPNLDLIYEQLPSNLLAIFLFISVPQDTTSFDKFRTDEFRYDKFRYYPRDPRAFIL